MSRNEPNEKDWLCVVSGGYAGVSYGKVDSNRKRRSEWTRCVQAAYVQFMMLSSTCEAEKRELMRHAYGRYIRHAHRISFVSSSMLCAARIERRMQCMSVWVRMVEGSKQPHAYRNERRKNKTRKRNARARMRHTDQAAMLWCKKGSGAIERSKTLFIYYSKVHRNRRFVSVIVILFVKTYIRIFYYFVILSLSLSVVVSHIVAMDFHLFSLVK